MGTKSKSKNRRVPPVPPSSKEAGSLIWAGLAIIVAAFAAGWFFGDVQPQQDSSRISTPFNKNDTHTILKTYEQPPQIDPELPVKDVLHTWIPKLKGLNYTLLNEDPPIYLFPNFLSDDECELLVGHARDQGLERSTTTGKMGKDGRFHRPTHESRTSNNAWCFGKCFSDTEVHKIENKIAHVVSRPRRNMEHFQLLHYEVGQEYQVHHDFIYDQSQLKPQGARQFTFFLYLNDVLEGGETHFPKLDLKVKPQKGAALLWPNVQYSRNDRSNDLTQHAALPVLEGHKFAANKWVHEGDFLQMWEKGASG